MVIFGAGYLLSTEQIKTNTGLFSFSQVLKKPDPTPTLSLPKTCSGKLTPDITEGPYYKENSPARTNLIESGVEGEKFTLTGYVFDLNCQPVAHAWIDFWQADASGQYDDTSYRLRGHQHTDSNGTYHLETIIPGQYTSRTPHIHAKVQANSISPLIMTQLYFPEQSRNAVDPIYTQETQIQIIDSKNGKIGSYNFIVEVKQ